MTSRQAHPAGTRRVSRSFRNLQTTGIPLSDQPFEAETIKIHPGCSKSISRFICPPFRVLRRHRALYIICLYEGQHHFAPCFDHDLVLFHDLNLTVSIMASLYGHPIFFYPKNYTANKSPYFTTQPHGAGQFTLLLVLRDFCSAPRS